MGPSRTFCASALSNNRGSRLSSKTDCVQSTSREECFCVANTAHTTFAHRKMRNRLTLGLRRKQRRKRVETVSYLDIEQAQYNAELEKYNMGYIVSGVIEPTLCNLAKAPGIRWDESVSAISEGVALMSLWDGPS
ncbi:hypothetical protein MVEN_02203100 [Mycena venus]|uniref:Uncharacterized protein n=1 Tax=Mycena venus TaxID=2733690 RepID=A0A8H6X7G6_9AGAR|nr:hypothetical protein MVEN_02203100 [Mycena venus]